MILVSWNCAGALRKKFHALQDLAADVYIVQECEDPAQCKSDAYREWAGNYLWVGKNKNRGMGIFARPSIRLESAPLESHGFELFLPCTLNGNVLLVAVWTQRSESYDYRYIGQLWKYIQIHGSGFSKSPCIVIGDLNSNAIWDRRHAAATHSGVVSALSAIGLESAYHSVNNAVQGKENVPTFFLQRNLNKPYHIDYAFLPKEWISSCRVEIGDASDWLELSDHMPLRVAFSAGA
jgi:hypothetical protein